MTEASTGTKPLLGAWTVPALNATNRAWFTSGALALQQCDGCGVLQHPPEEICHSCGAMEFSARVVSPHGTVYSYTIVHHSVNPALDGAVPYVVVLVALDDAPQVRVVGNLRGVPLDAVSIGMPVAATWDELAADDGSTVLLAQWERAGPAKRDRT